MRKVNIITDSLRKKILELLYKDEMYNAILIELIQSNNSELGDLYISENEKEINVILHVKNDGNSDLTTFAYKSKLGLRDIGCKIKEMKYNKLLLAGKLKDIQALFEILEFKNTISPDIFYKLNIKKYQDINMKFNCKIRLATSNEEDIDKVKSFTTLFLEAETEEEIESISNNEKILEKINNGIYLLDFKNNSVGMSRFIGRTNNFLEITSVYIHEPYRHKGFGRELVAQMIEIAIKEDKIPVLATSHDNIIAMKLYETMGFEKQEEYAYEFLVQ